MSFPLLQTEHNDSVMGDSLNEYADYLAQTAVQSLIEEAQLSPKPGLVDKRSAGCHQDMSLALMERSAYSLYETFHALAEICYLQTPNPYLREKIGEIGRAGELQMLTATQGVNTHRGAIWALGLLVCACAMQKSVSRMSINNVVEKAAELAKLDDQYAPTQSSKGQIVRQRYGVCNAKDEAQRAFPHVTQLALPQLLLSRKTGATESQARINALLAIMSSLTDTCVLSRSSLDHLYRMHRYAKTVLAKGGIHHPEGLMTFYQLEQFMKQENLSPGGAADLLAATLFLDKIVHPLN